MKLKDWSKWKVNCSSISEIMTKPKIKALPKEVKKRLDAIQKKDELTEEDTAFLEEVRLLEEQRKDPPLSATATKFLTRRYSWEKYNKRIVSIDQARSTTRKGTMLEDDAIEIVSSLDKIPYKKEQCQTNNDYLNGVCDVFHNGGRKIIDVKASWNIYTFMPNHTTPIKPSYWFQMQGYMELYDADVAEVCYVLVNTPHHLVSLERTKLNDKYMMGEIDKDKWEEGMESLEYAFDYSKIPLKRRVIRQEIARCKEIIPLIYRNVDKCRLWLSEFDKIHMANRKIIIAPDKYVKPQKDDDNPESDTADPRQGDEG